MTLDVLREATGLGDILGIPKRFKSYKVIKTIGVGGHSVVVKVKDVSNREEFAAKVMRRPEANTESCRLIERELRLCETVACPYLVNCAEIIYLEDFIVVIMEYFEGTDLLTSVVESRDIILANWRSIFRQLCLGVQYLHKRGLAHRDLKPENVLITKSLNCKLCDYGLLCETTDTGLMTTTMGTLPYMSPEMVKGTGYGAKQADIWALGIMLHVIVNGCLPWKTDTTMGVTSEILKGDMDVTGMSSNQREIIQRCCDVDPKTRATIEHILTISFIRVASNVHTGLSGQLPNLRGGHQTVVGANREMPKRSSTRLSDPILKISMAGPRARAHLRIPIPCGRHRSADT